MQRVFEPTSIPQGFGTIFGKFPQIFFLLFARVFAQNYSQNIFSSIYWFCARGYVLPVRPAEARR